MTGSLLADELPIAIRAYVTPTWTALPDKDAPPRKPRKSILLGASGWTLIFDTETTSDAGQSLRFGTYQLRRSGELIEAGIFYDPEGLESGEVGVLRCHADAHGLKLRTRDEFVDEVFFARAYQLRATIVGFNLPFDISRLAISHGPARTPQGQQASAMRGGFTFKLSRQKIYPNIRVKHMSRKAALISFAARMEQPDTRGQRKLGNRRGIRRGHFIDVKTLASALFAKGFSLASLSRFLEVPNPKLEFDAFDGPVTDDMARYAVRDVQTTWECYTVLIERFSALKFTQTIPEKIYSEAGIGKAYIREMGIAPWRKTQPNVSPDLLAKIMGSYFGGRSEVRIRREIRQVILCDFLSMYPTVCTLMGLWRFVIADGMSWQDTTEETSRFLSTVDLAALSAQPAWRQLATLVRVVPDDDIFPVRAAYSGEAQSTIGANYLTSETPLWFTLADCIAAKLLTGKTPRIVEAMSFAPGPVQAGLKPIEIAGNPEYRVDPNDADFFKRVIELRQAIKRQMAEATGEARERLDIAQNNLKICANSTSYGIWVEVNVETRPAHKSVTVHSSTCDRFSFPTDKAEMPGKYFHPLLATLITGAARLMLAVAERLATDSGLDWAFCDTDSMAFAKPHAMDADDFASRTKAIVDWFTKLNPYEFGGTILQVENVNRSIQPGEAQPLFCFAISSKRYALFNLADNGGPIMRKVSAHGLGHLLSPYGEGNPPPGLPQPHSSVLRDGTERWHCDLWHRIVEAALAGRPDMVRRDYHSALNRPAVSRYAATSPELLRWFKSYNAKRSYRDQVKPFGFLLSLSSAWAISESPLPQLTAKSRRKRATPIKPIAPFETDLAKAASLAFDRDTGETVAGSALGTYAEALAQYHVSPESKFAGGDYLDRGTTRRRHVRATGVLHIGKEAHDWERQAIVGLNADSELAYGIAGDELAAKLRAFRAEFGEAQAAKTLRISATLLRSLASRESGPGLAKVARTVASRLPLALRICGGKQQDRMAEFNRLRLAVELDGLRETGRKLAIDPSNLRRKLANMARPALWDRHPDE